MSRVMDLEKLLAGHTLSGTSLGPIFRELFEGKLPEPEAKSLLLLLARRGETASEISACLKALREVEPPLDPGHPLVMDVCGTGGDHSHSFNISTLTAFTVAGSGVKVAKHGNRSLSSRCGSSDLMEALGVPLAIRPEKALESLAACGFAYFHAPEFHPAFARLQPLRKSLGIRTILNHLGPLANPVRLSAQMVGVARSEFVRIFAEVLLESGIQNALVVHGHGGLDEISLSGPSQAARIARGRITFLKIDPRDTGLPGSPASRLRGGDISENRRLAIHLLQNRLEGPLKDAVLLNAAAALWTAGKARDLSQGLETARESLESGKAYQVLLDLIRWTSPSKLRNQP